MSSTSGSGAAGPAEAHIDWFGQPSQAAARRVNLTINAERDLTEGERSFTLPLSSVPVPGQVSGGGSTKLMTFCNLCFIMFDQVDQKDSAYYILHSLFHLIVEAFT